MSQDRSLRALTLLTTALATPLLIGCTVASLQYYTPWYHRRRTVSTFCFGFIPLAITAASSIVATARPGRLSRLHISLLDFSAAITYVALLIPIWAVEVSRMNKGGLGLLIGYTTAPMIVNMFFHIYSFVCNLAYVSSQLFSRAGHECPNCHTKFNTETIKVAQNGKGGEGYSLLRGEDYLDEDAVAYTEARASEEQVGVEGVADVEEVKGKGTIKL